MAAASDGGDRRRRRLIAIGLGVLVLVLVAVGLALRVGGEPQEADAGAAIPEDASPAELAGRACAYLAEELPRQIREDAAADTVRRDVARAERQAAAAAAEDVQHVPLASGIAALQSALEQDDPGAAAVAIDVVIAECDR